MRSLKRDIASTIHVPFVPWRAFPCSRFGSRCAGSHRNPAHVSGTYPAGIIERAIPFRNDQRKQKVLLTRNMISKRATVCRAVRRGLPLYARVLSETIHRPVTRCMSVVPGARNRRISRRLHFIPIADVKRRTPIYARQSAGTTGCCVFLLQTKFSYIFFKRMISYLPLHLKEI